MIKQIAWNTFKTTGDINTMIELLKVDKTINNLEETEEIKQKDIIINKGIENIEKKWEL